MTQNSKWIVDNDLEAAVTAARQAEIVRNNKISGIGFFCAICFFILSIISAFVDLWDFVISFLCLFACLGIMIYFRDHRTPHSWY
jgi:hypothetical protein